MFRLLVRMAPQGARPTEIAGALGLKQNTLSHHLSGLEAAGLVAARRDGRSLVYTVQMHGMGDLLEYLVNDCCRNRPDLVALADASLPDREGPMNVLFVCSGNSARSIFAEAILTAIGGDRFRAFSAGTRPGTALNPYAVEVLHRAGYDTASLRSKHISDFQAPDAPRMDFVFTVCDTAAAEECAPWPGQPVTAHWGVPDPVRATGTDAEKALAFGTAFKEMHRRITAFAALAPDQLDRVALQTRVDRIGLD